MLEFRLLYYDLRNQEISIYDFTIRYMFEVFERWEAIDLNIWIENIQQRRRRVSFNLTIFLSSVSHVPRPRPQMSPDFFLLHPKIEQLRMRCKFYKKFVVFAKLTSKPSESQVGTFKSDLVVIVNSSVNYRRCKFEALKSTYSRMQIRQKKCLWFSWSAYQNWPSSGLKVPPEI